MNKQLKEKTQKTKNKKQLIKLDRLQNFLNKDLCSCGPENSYLCKGPCRESHKNENGIVVCHAKYSIAKQDIVPRTRSKKNTRNDSDDKDQKRRGK